MQQRMQVKDTAIKDIKFYQNKHDSNRLAWIPGMVGSVGIIPFGLLSGSYRIVSGKFTHGLSTIGYSLLTGLQFTAISAVSILYPSFGAYYVEKSFLDAERIYNHPRDGMNKLNPEQYPLSEFTYTRLEDVKTDKGMLDAIEVSHKDSQEEKILIKFGGRGHNYQEVASNLYDDALALHCKVITANYPGITSRDYEISSGEDMKNVGLALVYNTAKRYSLTNEEIGKRIILEGYSMGGPVALFTASYFKRNHQIDIPVFVNRSFWTYIKTSAGFYNETIGLPKWYGETLLKIYYYASSNFEMDSIEAYKDLNPDKVDYINVEKDICNPRGVGFADGVGVDIKKHYFKWDGTGDSKIQANRQYAPHIAPNETIKDPQKEINARDYFRFFANRMWEKNKSTASADLSEMQSKLPSQTL